MSQDEFTKLFRYMTQRFDSIEKALESKADKADIERVLGLLNAHEKCIEILDQERLITGHQLERLVSKPYPDAN